MTEIPKKEPSFEEVKKMIRAGIDAPNLTDLEVGFGSFSLRLKRKPGFSTPQTASHPETAPVAESEVSIHHHVVETPLLGVLYFRRKPEDPPMVHQGQHVTVGTPVALIEAMKTYNEVLADRDGVVVTDTENDPRNGTIVQVGDPVVILDTKGEKPVDESYIPYR